jgi:hypothetical protein
MTEGPIIEIAEGMNALHAKAEQQFHEVLARFYALIIERISPDRTVGEALTDKEIQQLYQRAIHEVLPKDEEMVVDEHVLV